MAHGVDLNNVRVVHKLIGHVTHF